MFSRCFVGRGCDYNESYEKDIYSFVNYNNNSPLKYSFSGYRHNREVDIKISKKLEIYEE